jgi:hypothetical protein
MPRIPLVVPPPEALAAGESTPAPSLYAHAPTIQRGARLLDNGIGEAGGISPQLRRLMNVRVASIVGCPF